MGLNADPSGACLRLSTLLSMVYSCWSSFSPSVRWWYFLLFFIFNPMKRQIKLSAEWRSTHFHFLDGKEQREIGESGSGSWGTKCALHPSCCFPPYPWTLATEHVTTNQKIFYITATILANTWSRNIPTDNLSQKIQLPPVSSPPSQNGSSKLPESPRSTASPEKFYQPCNIVTS